MPRPSNRDRIVSAGMKVIHEQGYGAAGVRDIVQAAGVPQGSFTNHFASKEAFGLEALELYFSETRALMGRTLENQDLKPLDRLRGFIEGSRQELQLSNMRNGCLYGNLAAEIVDQSDAIRRRLIAILSQIRAAIADCLSAAIRSGDLAQTRDPDSLAASVLSGLQGAILMSKIERSLGPVDRFKALLFNHILA